MLKDGTGREFNDELTDFFKWYMSEHAPTKLYVPFQHGMSFSDGVTGIVLYREEQFQVQMFIVDPNFEIPEHTHPNVDSYEVYLSGMTFSHNGKTTTYFDEVTETAEGLPDKAYHFIRVLPNDRHGGTSSDKGGCFLSVQHWRNGIQPTTVGDDWDGKTVGPDHAEQVSKFQEDLEKNKDKPEIIKLS